MFARFCKVLRFTITGADSIGGATKHVCYETIIRNDAIT